MAFHVSFSEQAAHDLSEIIEYINDKLYNPLAAERFYNEIGEKLGLLSQYPYMYLLCHDEKLNEEGYRFAVIGNFIMFYLVDDDKSVVNISRILYGKRDIQSLF